MEILKWLFQFPFILHNFQQLFDWRVSLFLATLTLYFSIQQNISFVLEDDPFEVKLRDNYAVCCYSLLYVILLHARCLDNTDKLALLKSSLKTETKREREK